jgi:predicted dehydrogenase
MIWLVGVGYMGKEYAKVLKGLGQDFVAIGRGEENAQKFSEETGVKVLTGGIDRVISETSRDELPQFVIIATNVDYLSENVISLINSGVKNILVEKPASLKKEDLEKMNKLATEKSVTVSIAYNRRFYASVIELEKRIKADGGLKSFTFEFTEWVDRIGVLEKSEEAFSTWFLGNSTHVVDLAFFVGGDPKEISCFTAGEIDWHKKAAYFSGAGVSEKSVLFSYYAGWDSPGRWALEFMTRDNRYYLKPMEKLAVQKRNAVAVESVEMSYEIDEKYKPGLFLLTKAFLNDNDENRSRLCTLGEQVKHFETYYKMANYA